MKIGIAISTYNRPDLFKQTLAEWQKYKPPGAELIVVRDRDEKRMGIPKIKNLCLKLLESQGVTDYFLVDDDVVPLSEDWYKAYIESGQNHLMLQFDIPGNKLTEIYRDDKIVAYNKTRGAMLYARQIVLDTVGGLDESYGLGWFEHTDWTNRIHNAGLTEHRAADVVGSNKLLYCLDQDGKAVSSIPAHLKRRQSRKNFALYQTSKLSKSFKEYR
jgi:hypothetical protein